MSREKRLAFIVLLVVVCFSVPVWMIFHPGTVPVFTSLPLALILLVFCVLPVYPMYLQMKRWPQYALAIMLLIGSLACAMAYTIAEFVLHLDGTVTHWIANIFRVLIMSTCVLFIWYGFRKRGSSSSL
jgi:hypothetical protein